jgi:Flp pilus assembly protein TadB
MTSIRMARYAGWSAYGSAAAGISGPLLVLAVFILNAQVDDPAALVRSVDLVTPLGIASMVELLALLPVALVLYQLSRARAPIPSRLVLAIGLVGLVAAAGLQALFVARAVPLEHQASLSMTAFGLIGLWLLLANQLGRSQRTLPAPLAWLGAALGPPLLVLAAVRSPTLAFLAFAAGSAAPLAVLGVKASRRRARFQEQLPATLQLLAGAMQAGHGLLQAASTVVAEAEEPIAGEFQRVLTETRLGRPLQDALAGMATRMQSLDFQWTVMAIGLQGQVGGNLAEVLGTVAQTIRERAVLARQVRALSAEGRLSAAILSLLPPLLLLALLAFNPAFVAPLWSTRTGLLLLGGAGGLMAVGILWLRKLVQIEV